MSLQNIQSEFLELLFSADDAEGADLLTPSSHLAIYRRNIRAQMTHTLAHIYPMIVKLTGKDFFQQLAGDYLLRYPSRSGNLNDYGEYFPDFVRTYPGIDSLYYLSDIATFEWHCHALQFAGDHPALDLAALEAVSPDQYDHLHFVLHPATCLMKFSFPLLRVLSLCNTETEEDVQLDDNEEYLLIRRASPTEQKREVDGFSRDDVMVFPLTLAEYHFLSSLHAGNALGTTLENTLKLAPDFKLVDLLPLWIQRKVLISFYSIDKI